MTSDELFTVRNKLVDAWYQAAGCREPMCTNPECCAPLAAIASQVGLAYDHKQHQYIHEIPTLVTFEEEMILQIITNLVDSGNICQREILSGMMECPESMGHLLYGKDFEWNKRLRNHADYPPSNAAHILLAKEFLHDLSRLAIPDSYLKQVDTYNGRNPYPDSIATKTLEFARFIAGFAARCTEVRRQLLSGELEKWDVYSNKDDFRRMENAELGDYSTWDSLGFDRESCLIKDLAQVAVIVLEFNEHTDFAKRTLGALHFLMDLDSSNQERKKILEIAVREAAPPQEFDRLWPIISGKTY